ncbi:MAG: MarR family transcriptional regulator, partial [Chloroflexota bacterium]|nr:MarR family transcriptional regulator [Chloroflexota bacterium]
MAVETDRAQLIAHILELEEKMEQALFYPLMPVEWLHAELTMSQLKTLLTLSTSGPARTGTLASALGVSLATTTGIVDRLVERDL